ncbi:L-lactate dehydrogenase (cytochrome)/(S)-mandelate dehydrogenase [Neorhizobium galegae]|uniref:alpha-hydroxy acid oxidase n=1 Tax=Neorhizobium galegae TaxID=399 RepID=UPI002780FAF7|nr:alpha-hydroxy acid oxidase [Neorhizobium galegae]MDQ0138386.1 L-lactate dehydrogenase (cytochrome)/(S)-mandelate dehydrogenase [Neorhizobium galegae]
MKLEHALNIADLRKLARRRLPRVLFDVIESGVEDELGALRNVSAFRDYLFEPRYLVDVSVRKQRVELFGRIYDSPFGIAPMGFGSLFRRGCELDFARAAKTFNVPFIHSGVSVIPLEAVVEAAPDHVWCHFYPGKSPENTLDYLERAAGLGVQVLVLTVDAPIYPKRERDIRSGFTSLKIRPLLLAEAALHPQWVLEFLKNGGTPMLGTWQRYAPPGSNAKQVSNYFRSQSPSIQTWEDVKKYRAMWQGKFVLKGLLSPSDAELASNIGIDGIIVSNHGAKAYDPLPAPVSALPSVKEGAGRDIPVMVDGGIRRGSDILAAFCLGASFSFLGRAALYGAVAGGLPGASKALAIMKDEVDRGLGLIGCPEISRLTSEHLIRA